MNTPAHHHPILHGPIAVIGAGTMGIGIAQVAAQAGYSVLLFDVNNEAAQRALETLHTRLHQRVEAGKAAAGATQALLQRITRVDSLQALAPSALVIEAIIEQLEVKQNLFRQLEPLCSAGTIFASNTSSLSITAIARVLASPQRMAGLHFFNPAPLMKLVEIIQGLETSSQTITTLKSLVTDWQKQPVVCRSTPGFIVNRIARPFYAETLRALEENVASPATLDAVMKESGGFAMGALQLTDLIGHDVNYAVTESLFHAFHGDPRFQPSLRQKELVEADHLGRKRGQGFYVYDSKEKHQPLPRLETLQEQIRPARIQATGDWGTLPHFAALLKPLLQQYGIAPEESKNTDSQPPALQLDDVILTLTQGKTSAQLADEIRAPVVQFDLAANHQTASIITLSSACQNTRPQTAKVISFLQSLGKQVILLPDYPALLTMRTVAMLCNEALDAINKSIASAADIDLAMCYGVNYPIGPLAWGEQLGWRHILSTLENLQQFYGEPRYRPAPLLRQLAAGYVTLHLQRDQNQNKERNHVR
ncbi:3-hydroxybutyryl-CoA dehydrogenase,phenylacetic acid degradation [Xenorhabdus bovienii str. Jollieti]|uniref:3-hydroxybutyryl-CoA dehydrogenase, phenylacetic acid degradation n=1 Tax=Xenorhabdus bovienii (strain SS-2004) TaxID=406818 RepID=D3UY93_XENBS|nr:3-hydroxyacyl-CoA dehydrogenase [Xenorhabdus bovienii]CBJ79271.1 3-hydroxybutyryl-CoA dehydrogenase, phenylacetic acid degradation [Xenorhabdus bovienii SS-2004]CDH29998.1 3-hydroxybutyryl-CoA dehydrogenase,phenylacetic acid degradation [Xenorhabdus bovienii str. Jollieti]